MREIDQSPETLQAEIANLKRMIEISGIPETSLMGHMLTASVEQACRAFQCQDWESVERGLVNTRNLLMQCTL